MNRSPRRVLHPAVRRPAALRISAVLATTAVAGSLAMVSVPAAQAESAVLSPTGSLIVTLRGNGHGHGMSQYGAYGAATRGLNYAQILRFYYPGTTLTTLKPSAIRVRVSGYGSTMTVAAYKGLQATGMRGALPTTGISKYRFARQGAGFALQQLAAAPGSTWRTLRAGLTDGSAFARSGQASVRVFRPSGSSTRYLGVVKIFRSGSGAYVVNRVSLDNYTAGVVSREMPTSWRAQAVNSQAVAARTYGRYAVEHPSSRNYDICDTTQCQVYGGRAGYSAAGHITTRDYQPAATATANRVLRYKGKTIFAQFSASNGGYISDGGQPYLRAKADPYEASAPGNPYLNYQEKVAVRSLGSQFGFAKLTGIAITRRDGGGAWGGRVDSVRLSGTSTSGKAKTVTISGTDLQWAMGAGTTMFTVRRG